MGVYIKGMEMPKTCCACFCARDNECGITRYEPTFAEWYEDGVKDCPLVHVPPHGRLIDADALMLEIQEYIEEYGWETDEHGWHNLKWCAMKEAEMAIKNAPTIIPPEEE